MLLVAFTVATVVIAGVVVQCSGGNVSDTIILKDNVLLLCVLCVRVCLQDADRTKGQSRT